MARARKVLRWEHSPDRGDTLGMLLRVWRKPWAVEEAIRILGPTVPDRPQ